MNLQKEEKLRIEIPEFETSVSGILMQPKNASHLLVLAHGAGAGMEHPFMNLLAAALSDEEIATLRFNFMYMEKGNKAPDRPKKAFAAIKAAVDKAESLQLGLPILIGGKSFGGRMSSLLMAENALEGVTGLVYFGFPLHAPGRVGIERAAHLSTIQLPMLFLQGTRDPMAQIPLISEVCEPIENATIQIVEGGNHSFQVLKKSGKTNEEVIVELASTVRSWLTNQ